MATVRGIIEITRPINALAAGLLTGIGVFVAGGTVGWPAGAAVLATILATAGGNTINDYVDRDIDRINAPDRPIPRGAMTPQAALSWSVLLFAAAIAVAVTLPVLAVVIATVNLLALVTYTSVFKGQPGAGNVLVGLLGGSTFPFGAAAVGHLTVTIGVLFVLAALSTIARELIKDVEDLAGDREEGLYTLPMAIGRRRSLQLASVLLGLAIGASPLPYLLGTFGWPYLLAIVPALLLMGTASYVSYQTPARGQRWLKYGMFMAIIAFVIGRGTVLLG